MQDLSRDGVDSFTLSGQEGDRVSDITKSHHEDRVYISDQKLPDSQNLRNLCQRRNRSPHRKTFKALKVNSILGGMTNHWYLRGSWLAKE